MSPVPPSRGESVDVRKALIDSAKHDAPSARSVNKARTAVMIAAAGAATTAGAATAAAASAVRLATIFKWMGIGVVSGLMVVGAAQVTKSRVSWQQPALPSATTSSPRLDPPAATVSIAPAPDKSAESRPTAAPRPGAAPPPSIAPAEQAEPEPVVEPPPPVASAAPRLAEEVDAMERARGAVARGQAAEAMAALDRYDREFPRGRMGHEAAYLRMQALILQGNRAAAQQMAESFLRANPQSPLSPRVRALLK
jgi:TolA-binding protein